MIQFTCECGQKLKVDDKFGGKKIRCPKCKAISLVPPDGDLSDIVSSSQPLPEMHAPDSEEYDFKSLPKLKSLDDLVDLEDDDDDFDDDEGRSAPPPPPATGKAMQILGVLLALIGLGGAIGSGYVLIPEALKRSTVQNADGGVEFAVYKAPNEVLFSMKYPKGWTLEEGGGSGGVQPWVRIHGAGCYIDVKANTAGAAIGGYGIPDDSDKMSDSEPVHKLHEFWRDKLIEEDSNYEESQPEFIKTGFGSTRLSKYQRPAFIGAEYGYRLTAFKGENWNAKAYCTSDAKFRANEALLREIILSVSMKELTEADANPPKPGN